MGLLKNNSVKSAGLHEVWNKKNNTAIIFIHGLNGDPFKTWKRDDRTRSLPELIFTDQELQNFDIFTFGYKTGLFSKQYDFKMIAELLYTEITGQLQGRELIFVGHSMGGLVIQQYIVNQYKNNSEMYLKQIKGAVFLGVPFKGSDKASLYVVGRNEQNHSLKVNSNQLSEVKEDWVKYTLRGGSKSVPKYMVHPISQLLFYGVQDSIVPNWSSSPLHLDDAERYAVDFDHTGICKIDETSVVFKHIKSFLLKISSNQNKATVISVMGYDNQTIEGAAISLDWTPFIKGNPRKYPSKQQWDEEIKPQLYRCLNLWDETWSKETKRIRIHGKLPLPAGLLIGKLFPKTKGTILEVEQNGEIWSSEKIDANYHPKPNYILGNNEKSNRAIIILSVCKDIHNEVSQFLKEENLNYQIAVNILPDGNPSNNCIETADQAVAYAAKVKEVAEDLKSKGIKEMYLFLNTPFSVALFTGHFLTVMPPIQTYDYKPPGYIEACVL